MLQSTVGASRAPAEAAVNRLAGAPRPLAPSGSRQTRLLAHTKMRPNTPRPANTAGQPSDCAVSKPRGAPRESDIRRPDTAIAMQVARRSGCALLATRAYTDGDTPAAAEPAKHLTTSRNSRFPATAVSRLA